MSDIMTDSQFAFINTQLKAPPGQRYRVILTDMFEGPFCSVTVGNFRKLERALAMAKKRSGAMTICDVYDRAGHCVASFGTP